MTRLAIRSGLTEDDFAVFAIPGFTERMAALRGQVRPRLVEIAEDLAAPLSEACGRTLFPHVAAHMRRSVNPPPETWAAWGPSARGYKSEAHLALGVRREGAWLRVVVKDEAEAARSRWAALMATGSLGVPRRALPAGSRLIAEGLDAPAGRLTTERMAPFAVRLARRRGAQCALGVDLPAGDPAVADGEALRARALLVFAALAPALHALSPGRPR